MVSKVPVALSYFQISDSEQIQLKILTFWKILNDRASSFQLCSCRRNSLEEGNGKQNNIYFPNKSLSRTENTFQTVRCSIIFII